MGHVQKRATQGILEGHDHPVHILGDPPDADECDVDPGDTITWTNNTKKDWTIHFGKKNPMSKNDFTVSANGGTSSVVVREDAKPGKYPYGIGHLRSEGQNGTQKKVTITIEVDPNVIVH